MSSVKISSYSCILNYGYRVIWIFICALNLLNDSYKVSYFPNIFIYKKTKISKNSKLVKFWRNQIQKKSILYMEDEIWSQFTIEEFWL